MTDLWESQKISCMKAILDEEINQMIKSKGYEEEGTEDYLAMFCRGDALVTLREKFKQIKGVYDDGE
jgi:hypothetical protein